MRLAALFLILFSIWPWEKDTDQIKKSSLALLPENVGFARTLRVALFYELNSAKIGTPASFQIKELPNEKPLAEGASLPQAIIRPDSAGIRIGGRLYPVSGLRITSGTKEVDVQNRKYHSAIQILKNPKGSLTVVNEIDVEDYLKGVLPGEMHAAWPEEALKAQAVISRTYAIFKNIENKDLPFSLSSDVESQVYEGKIIEQASTNRPIQKTRGEVLTYRGKIFPTFFHSTCGGRTTRADRVWNIEPHPCLKGVECNFCHGSKVYRWHSEFSGTQIKNLLAKKGYSVPEVQSIVPQGVDESGRVKSFEIKHSGGSLKIPAHKFRLAVGADRMRSTKVDLHQTGNQFVFDGQGWGHGVGLCQWGAKRLAELGYQYQDILRYYYPGSEIQNIDDFAANRIRTSEPEAKETNTLKRWFQGVKSYVEDL